MNGPQTQTGRSWLPKWLKCCKRGRQLEAQLDVIPPVRIQRSQPEQRPPNRRTHSGSPTRTRQTTEPRPPPEPLRRQNTYAINAVPVAPQMANSFTTNRRTALAEPPQPIQTKVENTRSFRIQSAHSKSDIKVLATQPHGAEKDLFRYLCPICFRYMDKILAFSCCHNYICFECVDDINENMAQKKMLEPLCCFCRKEDPAIIDVNAKETAKKYIDTPQETPVKNQGLNPRLVRVWNTEKLVRNPKPGLEGVQIEESAIKHNELEKERQEA